MSILVNDNGASLLTRLVSRFRSPLPLDETAWEDALMGVSTLGVSLLAPARYLQKYPRCPSLEKHGAQNQAPASASFLRQSAEVNGAQGSAALPMYIFACILTVADPRCVC